ncbi:MAG: GMC family oxidoreductase [Defluviicoccus sp.]|nr:MAG: GMC family oxidoreductase [Defluviicoccus sp.]
MLESGGLRMQRNTQELYEGENVGLPYELDTTRSRYFGGSTNCWGGFNRPFEDYHFQTRDWVPESGWPIGPDDLKDYYGPAHEIFDIENDYRPASVLSALPEQKLHPLPFAADSRLHTSLTRLAKERRCLGKAYRTELNRAANVTVYLHANVTALETPAGGASITAAQVRTLAGNQLRVQARWFVLATGAIENARLLLASNAVETAGVGNRYDQVGRYFMEHPRTVVAEVSLAEGAEEAMKAYLPRYALLRLPVAAEMNLSFATQREERLLDGAAYLELVLDGEEAASTKAMKQLFWDLWRGVRPRQPMQQIAAVLSSPLSLATFGWGLISCSERFIRCRRITFIAEQCPNPDSRVMLSNETDSLDMPRVKLDWRVTDLDHETVRRTAQILADELANAGILQVDKLLPNVEGDVLTPRGTWHHMGTTRMHEDETRGVVDTNCKLHGVGNLFIAGSSVFPTAGNHTPTLTIVALALRLADHLSALMKHRPIELSEPQSRTADAASLARAAREAVIGAPVATPVTQALFKSS